MSTRHLIDPQLLPMLEQFPDFELTREILPVIRQTSIALPPAPLEPIIEAAAGRADAPDIPVYLYQPEGEARLRPAILHIHGDGQRRQQSLRARRRRACA
jgi:acetyl esterase